MFSEQIAKDLKTATISAGFIPTDIVLSIPENPTFGDYTTNIPLQLSKHSIDKSYHSPMDIASKIIENFGHPSYLERVDLVSPGFINLFLKDDYLVKILSKHISKKRGDKRYLIEYAQPNTHKEFHIGHLRNLLIGESIARVLDFQGHKVYRVTYGSDIGPTVAKAIWAVLKNQNLYQKAKTASLSKKAQFLGISYAKGAKAYEENKSTREEIDVLNQKIYKKDSIIVPVWQETRSWSMAYFDSVYSKLGTEFDSQIWESEIEQEGKSIVLRYLNKIFISDAQAIIFPGEKYNLHTRVFINKNGNPTYEAKELGLTERERELFPFDYSLHIVGHEQADYFRVLIKVIELLDPSMLGKKKHISYGMVNLSGGKMSSREGTVVTADYLINLVEKEVVKFLRHSHMLSQNALAQKIAIGAVKFSMLKYSRSKNIIFDPKQSVSLTGDSGPYLQYTYARIHSLINESKKYKKLFSKTEKIIHKNRPLKLEDEERQVLRYLEYFESIVKKTEVSLEPNELCSYLLNLARLYNVFYQNCPVIGSSKQEFRLKLTSKVSETINTGLYLLGIDTPERM